MLALSCRTRWWVESAPGAGCVEPDLARAMSALRRSPIRPAYHTPGSQPLDGRTRHGMGNPGRRDAVRRGPDIPQLDEDSRRVGTMDPSRAARVLASSEQRRGGRGARQHRRGHRPNDSWRLAASCARQASGCSTGCGSTPTRTTWSSEPEGGCLVRRSRATAGTRRTPADLTNDVELTRLDVRGIRFIAGLDAPML